MNVRDLGRARQGLIALACLLLSTLFVARAEVAVSGGENPMLYILQIIIDDPEPVGDVWVTFGDPTSHKIALNAEGAANGDGPPSILRNRFSNLPMVAWAKNSPSGYDVVLSSFDNGAWTAPVALAASPADELDPVLVMNPDDGTVHLLYWVLDASPRVMHRQAPADLSSWSPPVQVSQPGQIACRPSGVFHDGVLRVAYEIHDFGFGTTPRQVVLATDTGTGFASVMLAVTQFSEANWPSVHSARGELWVDWLDTENEMTWLEEQSGGWSPVQIEPYGSAEDRDFHVRGRVKVQVLD